MISKTIIITIPHSKQGSNNTFTHNYDIRALMFANFINNYIKENGFKTIFIPGNINREICDLNRKSSCYENDYFKTLFNKSINENDVILLLDIHSFPNESNPDLPLYILDYNPNVKEFNNFSLDLYNFMNIKKINTGLFKGDVLNALIKTGYDKNIPSILLEVNESLNNNDIKTIAYFVSQWVNKM